ncbi:eCIS core domain-containing protein [Hymenobacter convexus]|uniref:eCIS core domain-containing protein n=1 Tax=Hymenobacter sp. CA1UV-4 TaxID=3063782 RepID=UPI0027122C13|nr:DUF4157 domain-containing protein [Hymenobacter sp. CA1UV-4]MDO7850649.1 DUF4157 domain-containing protein [Hymenobacter sp. CA1UV-4]
MPAPAPKAEQPKTPAAKGPAAAPRNGHPGPAALADNRQVAVAQRQMQTLINQSPRVQQAAALQARIAQSPRQQQAAQLPATAPVPAQRKANATGLPDKLKAGVENLSGYSLDDVKVHYNSAKPAELHAHAYAQGSDIHLAPGQERHLPHEAWHVVQQKQGRVRATRQLKGAEVNDDAALEHEADIMGARASSRAHHPSPSRVRPLGDAPVFAPIQGVFDAVPESVRQPAYHNTSFLARVSLVPLANETPDGYESSQLWVRQVKVSDDRPPTKFGSEGQRSHTVAWTLMRAGLQKATDVKLSQFIDFVAELFVSADLPALANARRAATALQTIITKGITALKAGGRKKSMDEWQQNASDLLTHFVQYYQLSEAATYADGRAVGHGEPTHMANLKDFDMAARFGALDSTRLAQAVEAAVGMFDIRRGLPPKTMAQVLHHWLHALHLAFPALYQRHSAAIVDGFYAALGTIPTDRKEWQDALGRDPHALSAHRPAQDLRASVSTSQDKFQFALSPKDQSTFTANVALKPRSGVAGTAGQAKLASIGTKAEDNSEVRGEALVNVNYFSFDQLIISQLKVADDRPKTRFGTLQRSHTVAWTLIRRHLMGFTGKELGILINFIVHEMNVLKNDIDKPNENTNIRFDAPAVANQVNTALGLMVANKQMQPLYQWQSTISELVETYVTLYQLSRSATYAKEETPRGHGEATAYGKLKEANTWLKSEADSEARERYLENNKYKLAKSAAKLVDAEVANGNLQPGNWMIATDHWLNILKGEFPELMSDKDFVVELKDALSTYEPKKELLVNYEDDLTRKERILIGLYESAKKELEAFPQQFQRDLKFSMRTSLNAVGLVPADYVSWDKEIAKIEVPAQFISEWNMPIAKYFRSSRGKGKQSVPTSALDPKGAPSIEQLTIDAKNFLRVVLNTREALADKVLKLLIDRVNKTPNKNFIEKNTNVVRDVLISSIEKVVEASAISEIDNFKNWFDLLITIEDKENEDEESEDAAMDSFGYEAVVKAIQDKNKLLASK